MGAHNSVTFALKPVYLVSKYTGILPLKYSTCRFNRVKILQDRKILIASLVYLIISNIRDFHYSYKSITSYIYSDESTFDAGNLLQCVGDIIFNFYMLVILYFVLKQVNCFPQILKQLTQINTVVILKNYRNVRVILLSWLTFFHVSFLFLISEHFLTSVERSISSFFQTIMSTLASGNQMSIEIQFWSICFIVMQYYIMLNMKMESYSKKNYVPKKEIEAIRLVYGMLHEICVKLNQIYSFCILSFLCIRNVYIQYAVYNIIKGMFDLVTRGNQDHQLRVWVQWLLHDSVKVALLFWICVKIETEVRE